MSVPNEVVWLVINETWGSVVAVVSDGMSALRMAEFLDWECGFKDHKVQCNFVLTKEDVDKYQEQMRKSKNGKTEEEA